MSREYKIKWRDSDLKELNRVVKNFNAKLSRLEKKNPDQAQYLPKFWKNGVDENGSQIVEFTDRLTVTQLKELINTRRDFNREINALKRFSRRGAEEIINLKDEYNLDNNIRLTKWQKTEMNRRLPHINRVRGERLEELDKIDITRGKKKQGYTLGEIGMGEQLRNELSPLTTHSKTMNQADLRWKFRTFMKESQSDYFDNRDELLRNNYISGLEQNFAKKDLKKLIPAIRNMSIKEFKKTFYAMGGNFEFLYPPSEDEYQGYLDELKDAWL